MTVLKLVSFCLMSDGIFVKECFSLVLFHRHGRKHDIMPSNINFRANVYALKEEGCTHLIVTTACGSLQENIAPGHICIPDQFIDRTHRRIQTFYDGSETSPPGISHIAMHSPFCERTRQVGRVCKMRGSAQ